MARKRAKSVFLGDPGPPKPESLAELLPVPDPDVLDTLSTRELLNLALRVGIDPAKLLGVDHCWDHLPNKFVQLNDRPTSKAFQYSVDIVFCNNCWLWWKARKPEAQDD